MLLAGDVGGTNLRLALFEEEGGKLVERRRARFPTRDFGTLDDALEALAGRGGGVGGGVAPKILPLLADGFFTAFAAKRRLGSLLARIPIRVVLDDSCAILGAARAAARAADRPARREVTP